jgi:hypothetical protein
MQIKGGPTSEFTSFRKHLSREGTMKTDGLANFHLDCKGKWPRQERGFRKKRFTIIKLATFFYNRRNVVATSARASTTTRELNFFSIAIVTSENAATFDS